MDADVTKTEWGLAWQRLEAVLPPALSVRHDASRCRVLGGTGNPLRNVVLRNLLAGGHTTKDPRRLATLAEEQDSHRTSRS